MIKIITWVVFIVFIGSIWYWFISELIKSTRCIHIWRVKFTKEGSLWKCVRCGKKKFYENNIKLKEVKK